MWRLQVRGKIDVADRENGDEESGNDRPDIVVLPDPDRVGRSVQSSDRGVAPRPPFDQAGQDKERQY